MVEGMSPIKAMSISSLWGIGGMLAIAGLFYGMGKLSETGTKDVRTSKGHTGTVYLDIPADGFGEIKISVSGVSEHVKAQSSKNVALPAGTQVRVVQVIDQTLVSVELFNEKGDA